MKESNKLKKSRNKPDSKTQPDLVIIKKASITGSTFREHRDS